jgi:hypothetical protein
MAKKKDAKEEEATRTGTAVITGIAVHGAVDGVQTPVGGEVNGTQSPNPVSDATQIEKKGRTR